MQIHLGIFFIIPYLQKRGQGATLLFSLKIGSLGIVPYHMIIVECNASLIARTNVRPNSFLLFSYINCHFVRLFQAPIFSKNDLKLISSHTMLHSFNPFPKTCVQTLFSSQNRLEIAQINLKNDQKYFEPLPQFPLEFLVKDLLEFLQHQPPLKNFTPYKDERVQEKYLPI